MKVSMHGRPVPCLLPGPLHHFSRMDIVDDTNSSCEFNELRLRPRENRRDFPHETNET